MMRIKRMFVALTLVGVCSFVFAGIASAYCGPGFSNKAQAISYYQHGSGAKFAPSLKHELVADGFMSADQSLMAFLQSDVVVNVTTPTGYTLTKNTSCEGNHYKPFYGLLVHSHKNVLAAIVGKTVHSAGKAKIVGTTTTKVKTVQKQVKQANGDVKVYETTTFKQTVKYRKVTTTCTLFKPFMKGYCRNDVSGKPFSKCQTANVTYTRSKTYTKTVLVKTIPKGATPAPSGSCNAINSPGAVVCSSFYVFVTCGGVQITITGATAEEAKANAQAYSDSHDCNTVIVTPPTTPPTPPAQVCTDKNASNYGGPLPCKYPPPPVVSPPMASMNFVQEIYASDAKNVVQARVCGHAKSNNGDILSISFKANYGHFDNPNYPPLTANGYDQEVCLYYTAPTEAGVKDQITMNVLDTTTKLSASSPSNLFDIMAAPGNPPVAQQ